MVKMKGVTNELKNPNSVHQLKTNFNVKTKRLTLTGLTFSDHLDLTKSHQLFARQLHKFLN